MPYIYFAVAPDTIGDGRTARNVSYQNDTRGNYVAEVDVVLTGETELDEPAYYNAVAANTTYNAALPPTPSAPTAPDVHGFEQATLKAFDPMRGIEIYAKYGLFMRMLDKNDWGGARNLLALVAQAGGITDAEHATLTTLLDENNIP